MDAKKSQVAVGAFSKPMAQSFRTSATDPLIGAMRYLHNFPISTGAKF